MREVEVMVACDAGGDFFSSSLAEHAADRKSFGNTVLPLGQRTGRLGRHWDTVYFGAFAHKGKYQVVSQRRRRRKRKVWMCAKKKEASVFYKRKSKTKS